MKRMHPGCYALPHSPYLCLLYVILRPPTNPSFLSLFTLPLFFTLPLCSEPPSQLPQMGPEQGFFRYATDAYVLYHLETPTGYKFVLTGDAQAGDLRPALWTIYTEVFTSYALRNPLYKPGTPIVSEAFSAAVHGFIKGQPGFSVK